MSRSQKKESNMNSNVPMKQQPNRGNSQNIHRFIGGATHPKGSETPPLTCGNSTHLHPTPSHLR
jgi:hypothetical protein